MTWQGAAKVESAAVIGQTAFAHAREFDKCPAATGGPR
jgi:hypothetical protein